MVHDDELIDFLQSPAPSISAKLKLFAKTLGNLLCRSKAGVTSVLGESLPGISKQGDGHSMDRISSSDS